MSRYKTLLAFSLLLAACQGPAPRPVPGLALNQVQNQVQSQAARPTVQAIPGETIVRLKPGVSASDYARAHGLQLLLPVGLNIYLFRGGADGAALTRDGRTLWAEANTRISLPPLNERPTPDARQLPPRRNDQPNDPLLPAQYGYRIIGTDQVWRSQPGRPEVVVAVVDSGIDASHPEFQGQLVPGFDFTLKEPGPGGEVDGYGHGTHVAGVIGARSNNGIGIAGVAPGCKLMPVRIFNDFGHSEGARSAAAVIWAVDHGAKVINASWGGPTHCTPYSVPVLGAGKTA